MPSRSIHHSEETKQILSQKRSAYLEEQGNGGWKSVRWYDVDNIKSESFVVRGLLELGIALNLNEENRYWIRKVYINYTNKDGNLRTYTPDFYLPDENLYIEAKGLFSDTDRQKLDLVMETASISCVAIVFQPWRPVNMTKYASSMFEPRKPPENATFGRGKTRLCATCGVSCYGKRCAKHTNDTVKENLAGAPHPNTGVLKPKSHKIKWPELATLYGWISLTNFEHVARHLGVSSASIRKYMTYRNVSLPPAKAGVLVQCVCKELGVIK